MSTDREAPEEPNFWVRSRWPCAALVVLALALRLLFWQATPDAGWPYSAWYKGDALVWLAWADAVHESRNFEAGLPMRPPGAAYLMAALAGGHADPVARLRFAWCLIGALTVGLAYIAVRRSFGPGLAMAVGILCAGSSGLMMLSTSLDNETPYLFLVMASLALWEPLRVRPRPGLIASWAGLHAIACLFRAEHLLYFVLLLALLVPAWIAQDPPARWRAGLSRAGLALAVFALGLAPWHASAWSSIRRFNTVPLQAEAATRTSLARAEELTRGLTWTPAALTELEKLPAASRDTARLFVSATTWVRGEAVVESLSTLEQAFGYVPRPLPAHPFVALYGGLNFHLANNDEAAGGFNRAPLDRDPKLTGGAQRYPTALIQGLPPRQLALTYPPHLQELNEGYSLGWVWIRNHPGRALRLASDKLRIFWSGAALGLGGHDLPLGLTGIRRSVDLAVPEGGAGVYGWRAALLLLAVAGAHAGRGRRALAPWLAYLLSKIVVTVLFFGYARQGASVIPIVVLLACLAGETVLSRAPLVRVRAKRHARAIAATAALVLLTIEVSRWMHPPVVLLDERVIGPTDALPLDDHRDRSIEVRDPKALP